MAATNGVNGTHQDFSLKNVPVENQRPLKVRVIGAGFSGICAAIRFVSYPVGRRTAPCAYMSAAYLLTSGQDTRKAEEH